MKLIRKSLLVLITVSALIACEHKDPYAIENYMKPDESLQNLAPVFPYIAKLENGVNYDNRFDSTQRAYFEEKQKVHKFSFERYYINKDSIHYFLIWKVAPSLYEKKIAIGGRYKKDASGKIYAFEELFNTPKMKLDELKEISFKLFDYMVENGNVDAYLGDFEMIEFPDGKCLYDKENHKWIFTDNERWTSKIK